MQKKNIIKLLKEKLTFGLELEGVFNLDKINICEDDIADYHEGEDYDCYNFFKLEKDSSVYNINDSFQNYYCFEIISKPTTYADLNVYFEKLKAVLNITDSFYNSVRFNKTTGGHIHIKINNNRFITNIYNLEFINLLNKNIFIFLDKYIYLFEEIKNNWFRSYAKKPTAQNVGQDRGISVNKNNKYNTIEIRSLNFNGIKNIGTMYFLVSNILDIVINTILEYNNLEDKQPKKTKFNILTKKVKIENININC